MQQVKPQKYAVFPPPASDPGDCPADARVASQSLAPSVRAGAATTAPCRIMRHREADRSGYEAKVLAAWRAVSVSSAGPMITARVSGVSSSAPQAGPVIAPAGVMQLLNRSLNAIVSRTFGQARIPGHRPVQNGRPDTGRQSPLQTRQPKARSLQSLQFLFITKA